MTDTIGDKLPPVKRKKSWVGWLALVAILLAGAAWFQLAHQQKRSTHNFSQLQSSFRQTLSSTTQLDQTTTDLQTQLSSQAAQLQTLQATVNRLQAENNGYETDIALQQVDRYLSQANLTLNFDRNIPGAIKLLQAADQRLNTVPEAQVLPLRQALANAIVRLQAIPNLDYVGILTKLNALRDEAASIPLFAITSKTQNFEAPRPAPKTVAEKAASTWEKTWHTTVQTLHSLVIIRNRDQNITPLISETQEQFLRQNLQLILQQAEWAVLQHNDAVYQFSLTQASEWIQRYFADNDQATLSMQNNIDGLRKINLAPQVPDLAPLLNQLHTLQIQVSRSRNLNTGEFAPPPKKVVREEADDSDDQSPAVKPAENTKAIAAAQQFKLALAKGELV